MSFGVANELQSELESLIVDYTEEHPKIKEDRFILGLVQTDIDRLSAGAPAKDLRN